MKKTNHYLNLTQDEKKWLLRAAALRKDASVDELIDSFLVLFPDRTQHEELTHEQIREKLTSRFNDVLYRTDRGYASKIAEKRDEYEQMFSSAFAVLNPLAQLNFYEQTFTHPKSKPSDKFKAINDAEKLKARLFPETPSPKTSPTQRATAMTDTEIKNLREKISGILYRKRYWSVRSQLSQDLKEKVKKRLKAEYLGDAEAHAEVLEEEGMHEAAKMMRLCIHDERISEMPPPALVALSDRLLYGRSNALSIVEIDPLLDEILHRYV